MKRLAILGSTGSIGEQTLDVVAAHPDRFEVVALAAGRRVNLESDCIARVVVHWLEIQAAGCLDEGGRNSGATA